MSIDLNGFELNIDALSSERRLLNTCLSFSSSSEAKQQQQQIMRMTIAAISAITLIAIRVMPTVLIPGFCSGLNVCDTVKE